MRYLALLFFFVGCSANRLPFEPTQSASGYSADGLPQASYELMPQEARWGIARVSSRGVYRVDGGESAGWVVHVGFAVENTGRQAVHFSTENVALELVTDVGVSKIDAERNGSDQGAEIAAGTVRSFNLFYDLPPEIAPSRVQHYTAVWAVDGPNRYAQRSEFRRVVPRSPGRSYCDNRPFDDLCDPFFYGISLYVHSVDYHDHPTTPDTNPENGSPSGGGVATSPFPKPRSRAD